MFNKQITPNLIQQNQHEKFQEKFAAMSVLDCIVGNKKIRLILCQGQLTLLQGS